MKFRPAVAVVLSVLLLASCGKKDVQSACYSKGDHEHLSDGKITRICMCESERVSAQNFSEKETKWVIALIEDKSVALKDDEKERWKEVSKVFWGIKRGCEAQK